MSGGPRVLVVGGGGREHALAWALSRAPERPHLYAAPGNAGIAELAETWAIGADEVQRLAEAARRERIDLVVIGPEVPLCAGLADLLAADGIAAFGPSRAAAEIEGSKAFCKALLRRHDIPTAAFGTFSMLPEAELFIDAQAGEGLTRMVVKADGLAAGKGVMVCDSPTEAKRAARELLQLGGHRGPGAAPASIIVEEFLEGREASLLALVVDGEVQVLPGAEDHKTIFDGARGPMTGGMGVVSPTPVLDDVATRRALDEVLRPTAAALVAEGRPFRGLLFAGLMMTARGPRALEFNCRFGDPETEAILPRLAEGPRGDLLAALWAVARGQVPRALAFSERVAATVVMAQAGYPGALEPPVELRGLEAAAGPDLLIFHAGTRRDGERLVTAGGRVLVVTGLGDDVAAARARAYAAVDRIDFPGAQVRRDIGARPPSTD